MHLHLPPRTCVGWQRWLPIRRQRQQLVGCIHQLHAGHEGMHCRVTLLWREGCRTLQATAEELRAGSLRLGGV